MAVNAAVWEQGENALRLGLSYPPPNRWAGRAGLACAPPLPAGGAKQSHRGRQPRTKGPKGSGDFGGRTAFNKISNQAWRDFSGGGLNNVITGLARR